MLTSLLYAQPKGKIIGVFTDNNQKPIPGASVSLKRVKDSSTIKAAITNSEGRYQFNDLKEDSYFILATSVGYMQTFSHSMEINSENIFITVPPLIMMQDPKTLQKVSIEAKKQLIENKIDKMVVNVDVLSAAGATNALEILERTPGVSVTNDGTISLQGKAGVIILIDNKKTFLSASELANILRSLPSSTLDQIEIMTSPSARYDASGNAGVINLKTKKNKFAGFNGTILASITAALYNGSNSFYLIPRTQNAFTFNYRKNKINLFGNYTPSIFSSQYEQTVSTRFFDRNANLIGFSNEFTSMKMHNNNHLLKIGIDYSVDKKNELSFVISGFVFDKHSVPEMNTSLYESPDVLTSTLHTKATEDLSFKNLTSSFSFKHLFDSAGKELTVDGDYLIYKNSFYQDRNTSAYDKNGQVKTTVSTHGQLPISVQIYSLKGDYTQKFGKNIKFETGIKFTHAKNNSLVSYETQVQNSWLPDPDPDRFVYEETNSAVYVNLNKQMKKFQLQGGLRLENVNISGRQVVSNTFINRTFTNIFPSGYINYNINKRNQLSILYSRRVGRPTYNDLNPFAYVDDSLNQRQGNPMLLPQFSNNIELKYAFKQRFIASINFNRISDVISHILKQVPDVNTGTGYLVRNTPENVAVVNNIGLSVIAPLQVSKWWNTNTSVTIYNNHYKGVYNSDKVDLSQTSFQVNLINTFVINKKTNADLTVFYLSKSVNELTFLEPLYYTSFSVRKQLMKDKGSLNFTLRDPFGWQQLKGEIKYGNIHSKFYRLADLRRLSVTFRYRFGKNQLKNPKAGSKIVEEQNRIDVTGNK